MSAEVVQAFQQEAHRLDAEADNADPKGADNGRPALQREIAQVLRNLALRSQGTDPAQAAADDAAASSSGLSVDKSGPE